jgi:predicted RNA-binding protein with PUA-like domain
VNHWLLKSEPDVFSIADLARRPGRSTGWEGVRNYQARNFMRDGMTVGDPAFFYHSSCPVPGIYGVVEVSRGAHPDPTQFDPTSDYHDPKSTPEAPRWVQVAVTLVDIWDEPLSLTTLRDTPALRDMAILQRGNRLSITPVTAAEWRAVLALRGRRTGR